MNKSGFACIAGVSISLLCARAEEPPSRSFHLMYTDTGMCRQVTSSFFHHSRHQKGDRHGLLNEHNYGSAVLCYPDRDAPFTYYGIVGSLINSQYGNTFVAGPGIRLQTPKLFGASLAVGYELPFIYYEVPKYHSAIYGFLPIAIYAFKFDLTSPYDGRAFGSIGITRRDFGQPKEPVHLYAFEWTIRF